MARKEFDIGVGIIVTLGGNGSVYGDKSTSEITHFPAKKVQVVDTTVNYLFIIFTKIHYEIKKISRAQEMLL